MALGVENHHGQHVLLLRALQHGGEQVGRAGGLAGEGGFALRQLPQGHRAQHGGIAVDDGLADFRAEFGTETHDHHGEDGDQQGANGQRRQGETREPRIHAVGAGAGFKGNTSGDVAGRCGVGRFGGGLQNHRRHRLSS